jgi:hypothetical protein
VNASGKIQDAMMVIDAKYTGPKFYANFYKYEM